MKAAQQVENLRFRFTEERLNALPVPKQGPFIRYDNDVKELGVRKQPSGKVVFFVQKKVVGKAYRKTLGNRDHLQLADARKHAHQVLAKVADWLAGDRSTTCPMLRPLDDTLTFADAFEMYLRSPRKRVKHISGDDKEKVMRVNKENKEKADARARYLFDNYLDTIANRPINELTPTVIAALHKKLTGKPGQRGAVIANRAHGIVRAVYNHLVSKGLWASVNPAKGATRNPEVARERILKAEELAPFLDALNSEANRDAATFFALLLACGVRKKNLYEAEWSEISFAMKTWTIPPEKSKNGKTMVLRLKKEAMELFKMRRACQPKDARWVFPSKAKSASGHVMDYKRQFQRILKAAELKNFTTHDIRRSFIALMVSSGKASMPVISAAAGHSSLQSMTPYARFSEDAVTDALDAGEEEMQKQMAKAGETKRQMDEAEKERKLLSA